MYIQQIANLYISKINEYKKAAELKGIRTAIYVGSGQVSIDGMLYDLEMASDIYLSMNQVVYVALNQQGTKAVIVG